MKRLGTATLLVLLGLGLGATLLRGQVPLGTAQNVPAVTRAKAEAAGFLQNEQNTMDIVSRYEPGLVYISTEAEVSNPMGWMWSDEPEVVQGVGSGFFVNDAGDILTNFHVVAGSGKLTADRIQIRLMNSSQTVPARVIGVAPQYDLALIRPVNLAKSAIKPIPLGDSSGLRVGQKVIAMGAPFGLDFSVTEGIVSSAARQIPIGFSALSSEGITQRAIQTDAAINPGNSGGPLLDSGGRVIGINTQIYSPSGAKGSAQSAGVGFAIPINAAKNLLPRLQKAGGGLVLAPRLGIQPGLLAQGPRGQTVPLGLSMLSEEGKAELGLPKSGLVVGKVTPNTPAARAGLRGGQREVAFRGGTVAVGGDVITEVGGEPVDGFEDLQAALIDQVSGAKITLKIVRDGKPLTLQAVLDDSAFQ